MIRIIFIALVCVGWLIPIAETTAQGKLLTEKITSSILRDNKIGLNPERNVKVYLPPGYATSTQSYPVVYYLRSFWGKTDNVLPESDEIIKLIDRGFARAVTQAFILVVADYGDANTVTIYENSSVSGRWLDFTVQELVPFIDGKFRTLKSRDSRAVVGHFFGGRGALKLGMTHAETFGVVYALHPVATGIGNLPWMSLPIDWKKLYAAKTVADAPGAPASIFIAVCQAALPNMSRPPFYCDFYVEPDAGGNPTINPQRMTIAQRSFHLEGTLPESAANLHTLRGLAMDWGHYDGNEAHVVSARNFSRSLIDLGIDHEAEEYNGDGFNRIWTDNGRFYTRVLPFLNDRLIFK